MDDIDEDFSVLDNEASLKFYTNIAQHIAEYGHSILGVVDDKETFFYTIGRAIRGEPEFLLVANVHPEVGTDLLNTLSKLCKSSAEELNGEIIMLGGYYGIRLLWANDTVRQDYTIQAGQFLEREDYDVVQVLIPDKAGRYPGDPACDMPYAQQPILRRQLN